MSGVENPPTVMLEFEEAAKTSSLLTADKNLRYEIE
jgi:hypothetical protein